MPTDDEARAATSPDDEDTDLSLSAVPAIALHRSLDGEPFPISQPPPTAPPPTAPPAPATDQNASTDPSAPPLFPYDLPQERAPEVAHSATSDPALGPPIRPPPEPEEESPWRFNALGAVLLTALICTLTVSLALVFKLQRTRKVLQQVEEANEASAISDAAARATPPPVAPVAPAVPPPDYTLEPPAAKPAGAAPHETKSPAGDSARADGHEQLLLLLTVGNRRYAEKQLLSMKEHCNATLAVYKQMRGRCRFDQCFVVATPAAEAEAARGCGQGEGHTLRDRGDFQAP